MHFGPVIALLLALVATPVVRVVDRPIHVSPDGKSHVQLILEGGEASMSRITAFPGAAIPVHVHPHSDEVLLIEAGAGIMTLGDKIIQIRAGQAIRIPKGTKHSFVQTGKGPLRAVQVYAPPGPEQRFKKWRVLK
jgi:mannose-6-phosphate isomerase-like protein (cupin superfamily)